LGVTVRLIGISATIASIVFLSAPAFAQDWIDDFALHPWRERKPGPVRARLGRTESRPREI